MSEASVSVIIPVHNGRHFLAEALTSVFSQSRAVHEVLVVDDGSTDGSAEVAREFPGARCVQQPHAGQGAALNLGIAATSGELLTFLDADDRWLSNKIELQLAVFARRPELDVVYGHARQFVEPSRSGATHQGARRRGLVPGSLPARLPSALMVRRAACERVGRFPENRPIGGVIDWFARAEDAGLRAECLPDVVYERRLHDENVGVVHAARRGEYARVLKDIIERRRARGVA